MKRKFLIGLMVPLLMLAACTSADYIAAIDLIVSSAEVVLSLVPATSPYAAVIDAFGTNGETIVDNLITCGTAAPCIATATAAFEALVVPVVPAQYQPAVTAEANAISAFINAWGSPAIAMLKLSGKTHRRIPPTNLSERDKGRLFDLHLKIKADLAKWAKA